MKNKGRLKGRCQGGAVMWVVILLMLAAVGYVAWKKFVPPSAPVIARATPPPATPPPATPEPVVVKATPTPPPAATPAPVVMATPPPPPTPPPLDISMVVRTPALWPKQVTLLVPHSFPILINGKVAGEVKAPVGTAFRVLRVGVQQVEVEYQNARQLLPLASTDLMVRALAAFRANGSVLPVASVATSTPPPAATPPTLSPGAAAKLKVEVGVEKKRMDLTKDSTAGRLKEDDKTVEKFTYAIKVQSREFVEIPPLEVQYLIFVERQKLGSMKDDNPVERIAGSGKTEVLDRKNPIQIVTSSEFELSKQIQNSKFSGYTNGGRRKVEDSVLGVWVKVLKEGQVVAEYANPSTVVKRGWDSK